MSDDIDDDVIAPAAQKDVDILAEARKRYAACDDAENQNRIDAVADLRFLAGGDNQWDSTALGMRRLDGRPVITVNSLPTYLHQVTNDQRMNTPSIKVHPTGGRATIETARVRQGLIRHIEYDSNADVAYDTSVNSSAAIGFGYFRLITAYESESSFDQKIMFQRIRNALSVRIDPLSIEPDGSDMKYAFVELKMSRDAFKLEYPDAKAAVAGDFDSGTYAGWITDTEVLVCDYYRIETTPVKVVELSNGESGFKDELLEMPPGVTITRERSGERQKVMLYKITGADILDKTEIKCRWIPVFPVYGDEIDIEGKIIRSGIVRHAKGPAQMYNVMMTAATEEVSLRSKTPYIGAEGQFEGHEDEWQQANLRAFPFLEYKPVTLDGNIAPPPQRNPMADVPVGMLALASHAADNIKKTTGLFDASLGARGTATSGVQEKAQQAEGDMANFHYADGLLRTIRHAGRCLNCMITHYYDSERTVAIMSEDNKSSHTIINQQQPNGVINDMTCSDYGITVTAGASYSTLRQENAEFFTRAMQSAKDPATAAVVTYLAMKNNDAPGADEATSMLKALLPSQVLSAIPGNEQEQMIDTPRGPLPLSQAGQAIAQMSEQLQQMQEALKKADAARQQIEAMKQQQALNDQQLEPARQEAEKMKITAEIKKAEAEMVAAEADLVRAQAEAACAPDTARTEAQKAHTEHMTAEINLLQQAEKLKLDGMKLDVEAAKADAALLTAGVDMAAAKGEIAKLIAELRPPPATGMTVKAPSGQVYDVNLKH